MSRSVYQHVGRFCDANSPGVGAGEVPNCHASNQILKPSLDVEARNFLLVLTFYRTRPTGARRFSSHNAPMHNFAQQRKTLAH